MGRAIEKVEITMRVRGLVIAPEDTERALRAINDLYTPEMYAKSAIRNLNPHAVRRFAYCRPAPEGGWKTLEEAINAWRFTPHVREDGAVVILGFQAQYSGDEELLFMALASIIQGGGEVVIRDIFDNFTRYEFTGECLVKYQGVVQWTSQWVH